jgi:hypothetical protein
MHETITMRRHGDIQGWQNIEQCEYASIYV